MKKAFILVLLLGCAPCSRASASLVITELSGSTQTNYPVRRHYVFAKGEITNCPQALVSASPVTTQANVNTRWNDGSANDVNISFVIASLSASSTVTITFQNQGTCNTTPLSLSAMQNVSYDFNAEIDLTCGSNPSVQARTLLNASSYTSWAPGSVANTIILADHSSAAAYDIGCDSHKVFRPIFEATFWATINKVRVCVTGEIANTTYIEDQTYDLTIKTGNANPATVYTKAAMKHIAMSRWHKCFWIGGAPGAAYVNPNINYLVTTGVIPNYDPNKVPSSSTLNAFYATFTSLSSPQKDLFGPGNWTIAMETTGGRPDIGPLPEWSTYALYAKGTATQNANIDAMDATNADLSAAWPWHLREGVTGRWFDAAHSVDAMGKVLSLNSRPTAYVGDAVGEVVSGSNVDHINDSTWAAGDKICGGTCGIRTNSETVADGLGGTNWHTNYAHIYNPFLVQYLETGDFFYLEEMQFWAAASIAYNNTTSWWGRGPNSYNAVFNADNQARQDAWVLRARFLAAYFSPDSSAEKAYFNNAMDEGISGWCGTRNLTTGDCAPYNGNAVWTWAHGNIASAYGGLGAPALHSWVAPENVGACTEDPQVNTGTISGCTAGFMEFYLLGMLGWAKQLGYNTGALITWFTPHVIGPIVDAGMASPYYVTQYRMPASSITPHQWLTTWAAVQAGLTENTATAIAFYNGSSGLTNADSGYSYLLLAATSYVTGETNGTTAYNWVCTTSGACSTSQINEDPKWAILPFTAAPSVITIGNRFGKPCRSCVVK